MWLAGLALFLIYGLFLFLPVILLAYAVQSCPLRL